MPSDTSKRPLTILPTFTSSSSSSSSRSPHIRTPSTSTFNSSPKRTPLSIPLKIPRSILKLFLFLSLVVGLVFLSQAGRDSGIEEGIWDASSYSERRGTSPGVNLRKIQNKFGLIAPPKAPIRNNNNKNILLDDDLYDDPDERSSQDSQDPFELSDSRVYKHQEEDVPKNYISSSNQQPNLNRESPSSTKVNHPGKSRRVIPGSSPEKYTTGPLPNLEEAWEFLHPLLREVKEKYQVIPREHELTAPIFPPFLTDDLVSRYRHLREEWNEDTGEWKLVNDRRWFMVTVCRQVAGMLADWFAAWTVLADFLGPESLVFSLIEGDSADGSGEIISHAMRAHLLNIGVPPENINIKTFAPKFDWEQIHRIEQLAKMRNEGMQPFYDTLPSGLSPDGHPWTGVVYYNDVYLSATHFLELMHQHFKQDADMTCGWDHAGKWFYDGWVGRDMAGDLYTPFPVKEEDKDLPQKLFPSSPQTLRRYERMLPFQVFAGWNGITVLNPQPFYPPYNVRFRRGQPRTEKYWECQASESSFISWDFWKYGFGRVQVVPGVHATYGKEDAMLRGWVEWPNPGPGGNGKEEIDWIDQPPNKVRCHDWPDKPGKGYWAWDTVRWVDPPKLEAPK
ncbi:hypothetical protein I204_00758 [Kwoniella mangroviensis CBS 8886]|uniref:uncharacterized protein n=1 Tax=Kwoniella mangroviensis CBS 8507 TaxID=1296122 RepID=UPI00080D296B|nr:uncharacterized protein I203_05713 [Kwoniella mangroviensis CBS 8507]OCF64971.1 hypothetical protein I203_05713 [Kwoniella mangroviensis CBS 8507]OCF78814.1 hypothetical protein I204_00758 [Kwoniella mangroviensis CBS 8886]